MRLAPDTMISGRYRLIRRIGAGGMADVWCADDEMLNRRVALKFLLERYAQDEQFVERFRREAAAAAGLQHPNVVGVFDRGEHEGRPFIAMEYVEGASLKDLIDRGLSVGEAVEITRQVLSGARFAHARGIIHRDLKPQNVLVDREGRARVADFGIARAGVSEITQTGSVLGTAQYLSPEQAQGLDVTAASDLYSVGAMMYEALTGSVPFDADSAVAVALKQVSEAPRPPSELNPRITPALDGVVLKALAKDPANRYQSADEFLAALTAAGGRPQRCRQRHRFLRCPRYAGGRLADCRHAAADSPGGAPRGSGLLDPQPPDRRWAGAAGADRRRPLLPAARLGDHPGPGPERAGGDRAAGDGDARGEGVHGGHEPGPESRSCGQRARAGSARRRQGQQGLGGDDHRLDGARQGDDPRRARPVARRGREGAQEARLQVVQRAAQVLAERRRRAT